MNVAKWRQSCKYPKWWEDDQLAQCCPMIVTCYVAGDTLFFLYYLLFISVSLRYFFVYLSGAKMETNVTPVIVSTL